jgi:hypothetical protein
MRSQIATLIIASVAALQQTSLPAFGVELESTIPLHGELAYADELSGVSFFRELLIACPDEGAEFNVLQRNGDAYELLNRVNLLQGSDDEIDMEAATSDSNYVYIVGSHSTRRKKVEEEVKYKKNRKRLTRVAPHEMSYSLFRVELDNQGKLIAQDEVSLIEILENDEILAPFSSIPGKENGIDIEGLAIRDGTLFVGFRGPVLRGNFVPVLAIQFDEPSNYVLKFVRLAGRGIRDMVAVEDGFLILAGPIGDGDASYQLYLWDGQDCVPGPVELPKRRSKRRRRDPETTLQAQDPENAIDHLVSLGELPAELNTKPEGLALVAENDKEWQLIVLSDGDTNASRWVVSKP